MSPRSKSLFLVIAVLIALPIVFLLGLNLVLQSSSVRERIHSNIEKSLGMPVTLGTISATPFGGIKVENLSGGAPGSTPHFTLDSLILYPCYLKLLQQEVLIRSLTLNHPVVQYSLADSSIGTSQITQTPQTNLVVTGTVQQPAALLPSSSFTPTPASNAQSFDSSQPPPRRVPSLTISDGEFTLLNQQNLPLASFLGMNLTAGEGCCAGWKGNVVTRLVTVGSFLIIHDLHTPVALSSDSSTINLDALTATLGEGKLAGKFSITLPPASPSYTAQLTLDNGSLNQFFQDASLGNAASEGVVSGGLQLTGIAGIPQSMEGSGSLLCTNAVIQPADFLKQIGQILQIQELQTLRLAEGKVQFTVHQGEVQINSVGLRSENLELNAQGPVRPNGDLDLQARLLFNEQLTGRLRGLLGSQLTQAPEPGYSQITFHISGPAKSPKTDLLERLTGIKINGDLGGFLQGIFGHPR